MSREFLKKQEVSSKDAKAQAISRILGGKKHRSPVEPRKLNKQEVKPAPAVDPQQDRLKLNRSYEEYMRSFSSASPGVLQPLMPSVKTEGASLKGEDLFAKDEEAERQKMIDRERLKRSLKLREDKGTEKLRKITASKSLIPSEEPIWCARCNKRHAPDFHKQTSKPVSTPRPPSPVPSADADSNLSDFIESEEEDHPDVSHTIRRLTGYDPRKYREEDDSDEAMEAGIDDIFEEERRTARIGRREDEEELRKLRQKHKKSL